MDGLEKIARDMQWIEHLKVSFSLLDEDNGESWKFQTDGVEIARLREDRYNQIIKEDHDVIMRDAEFRFLESFLSFKSDVRLQKAIFLFEKDGVDFTLDFYKAGIFLRSDDEIVFLDEFSVDGKKLNTKDAGSFNYKGYTNV